MRHQATRYTPSNLSRTIGWRFKADFRVFTSVPSWPICHIGRTTGVSPVECYVRGTRQSSVLHHAAGFLRNRFAWELIRLKYVGEATPQRHRKYVERIRFKYHAGIAAT